jgi:hypothetical protein
VDPEHDHEPPEEQRTACSGSERSRSPPPAGDEPAAIVKRKRSGAGQGERNDRLAREHGEREEER